MDQSKLTTKAREALQAAQALALNGHHPELRPVHLLHALLEQENGLTARLLTKTGRDPDALRSRTTEALTRLPRLADAPADVRASGDLMKVLDRAGKEAKRMKDDYVSTEHLLLAIIEAAPNAPAGQALRELAIDRDAILRALEDVRGGQRVTTEDPESTYEALEKYGRDLVQYARDGKLDPVIGRDEEIRRISTLR